MKIIVNAITANSLMRGAERYTNELITALSEIDKKNRYVIVKGRWQNYYDQGLPSNFRYITLPFPKSQILRNFFQAFFFPIFLALQGYDVVHYPNVLPVLFKNKKLVVTVHDLIEYYCPSSFNKIQVIWRKYNLENIVRKSRYVLAISNFTKKTIKEHTNSSGKELIVIYNGFRKSIFAKSTHTRIINTNYFLCVSVHEAHKNLVGLFKAYHNLPDEVKSSYKLVIVGREGPESKRIYNTVKHLKLLSRTVFIKSCSDADLGSLYRNAQIFLLVSKIEGFGLPILEAMACGVPIIASGNTALPEVCGDAALYIDPSDVNSIKNAMMLLVNNEKKRKDLISAGYERLKIFSWTETARRVLNVYERIVANHQR